MKTTFFITLFLCGIALYGQEAIRDNGKFVEVDGISLYYEESGEGTPLVLLHFFESTASSWDAFIPELSKDFRVIAIDLPGHGRSAPMDTTEVYLHKQAAKYIIGLLEQLDLKQVHVVGASSGAFDALYMAQMKPELLSSMVLIGSQQYYNAYTRNMISECCGGEEVSDRNIAMHGKEKAKLLGDQFYNFRKLYGDPSFTPDVLNKMNIKTLVIHGDNDFAAPVSHAWEIHQHLPNSSLWIVPGGGHLPYLRPENQEIFLSRLKAFLGDAPEGS